MPRCPSWAVHRACGMPKGKRRSALIRSLGRACGTGYYGALPVWPFSRIGADDQTCARLALLGTKYTSVGVQMQQFLTDVIGAGDQRFTAYRAYPENAVYAVLYLLRRNSSECFLLGHSAKALVRNLRSGGALDWTDVGLVYRDGELTLPRGFRTECPSGAGAGARFSVAILTLVTETSHHANILLFDRDTQVLERFDPYETSLPGTEGLDAELRELYGAKATVPPPDLGFLNGIQGQAEQEREETSPMDPVGFCQPWTVLYADARLSFPDQDPNTIPEMFREWARKGNTSLTRMIRTYAEHLRATSANIFSAVIRSEDLSDSNLLATALEQLEVHQEAHKPI